METSVCQLLLIDTASHTLLLTKHPPGEILSEIQLPPGCKPIELANQADTVYLAACSGQAGMLLSFHPARHTLQPLPLTLPPPSQFTLSPDLHTAYWSDPDGLITAISLASQKTQKLYHHSGSCVGLAAAPGMLCSAWEHQGSGALTVLSSDGQVLFEEILPGIPTNITVTAEGRIFIPFTTEPLLTEGVAMFTITQLPQPAVNSGPCCRYPRLAGLPGAYPCHVAICPRTGLAYTVNEEAGSLTVIDPDTAAILRTISLGIPLSTLHLLPGGPLAIAASQTAGELFLIDLHQGCLTAATHSQRRLSASLAVLTASSDATAETAT